MDQQKIGAGHCINSVALKFSTKLRRHARGTSYGDLIELAKNKRRITMKVLFNSIKNTLCKRLKATRDNGVAYDDRAYS